VITEDQMARVARLTEAQCEVLRHFHKRKTAKEIGRELGITHWAVNERLRSARRVLNVATSGEAARLLTAAGLQAPYNRLVCDPKRIAADNDLVLLSVPDEDGEGPSRAGRDGVVEERPVSFGTTFLTSLRLPLPRFRGDRNDVTIGTRLIWIGTIALGAVLILGGLITISWGVVRMVGELIRIFA
jgi:DNA-binding CsgD family transcriptional regulator